MLKKLNLRGFKLHDNTSLDLAPITIFIGENNSGKSSIFQALMGLRQAVESGTFCIKAMRQETNIQISPHYPNMQPYIYQSNIHINLGDFKDVLRNRTDEVNIELQSRKSFEGNDANINCKFTVKNNMIYEHSGSLETSRIGKINWKCQQTGYTFTPPAIQYEGVQVNFGASLPFNLSSSLTAAPQTNLDKMRRDMLTFLGLPREVVTTIKLIHPIRGSEESATPVTPQRPVNLDMAIHLDRATALGAFLPYNREIEDKVNEYIEKVLLSDGLRFELVESPPHHVVLKTKKGRHFIHEGTGSNQLPYLLTQILLTSGVEETILFSEPEAHLHPKAQYKLGQLLTRIQKSENKQFIIETHSPSFIYPFLYAIATKKEEERLPLGSLAIWYFNNVDGESKPEMLEIDEKGAIKGGLKGFAEQSLTELQEYLKSI